MCCHIEQCSWKWHHRIRDHLPVWYLQEEIILQNKTESLGKKHIWEGDVYFSAIFFNVSQQEVFIKAYGWMTNGKECRAWSKGRESSPRRAVMTREKKQLRTFSVLNLLVILTRGFSSGQWHSAIRSLSCSLGLVQSSWEWVRPSCNPFSQRSSLNSTHPHLCTDVVFSSFPHSWLDDTWYWYSPSPLWPDFDHTPQGHPQPVLCWCDSIKDLHLNISQQSKDEGGRSRGSCSAYVAEFLRLFLPFHLWYLKES